jgi:hypothetical protein
MADTDADDNIYDERPAEDGFDDKLLGDITALLEEGDEDEEGGLGAPMEEPDDKTPNTVGQEEGADLASEARIKGKPKADDVEADPKPKADAAEPDTKPEAKTADAAKTDTADDIKAIATADLLKDVPEAQRGEITRRLSEADAMLKPFQTEYAKAELSRHGASPQDAMSRLVELNEFAQQKPDEYLAWVATEMKADAPHEVLEGAAKLIGYKLVKDGGDEVDDEFLDDETKAIREENARLKAQISGGTRNFGPDTQERRSARDTQHQLQGFMTETDAEGKALRPYFTQLQPRIAAMAQEQHAATQRPVTVEDLGRFYEAAVAEVQQIAGGGANPAAQAAPAASQSPQDKAAAAAEKAKLASKSVDGTGQGAGRRPALPSNASIEDVIRDQLSRNS